MQPRNSKEVAEFYNEDSKSVRKTFCRYNVQIKRWWQFVTMWNSFESQNKFRWRVLESAAI